MLILLPSIIFQQRYDTVEEAKKSIIKGGAWGILYFNENYTSSVIRRIEEGEATPNLTVESSTVDIWLDMSSKYLLISVYVLFLFVVIS